MPHLERKLRKQVDFLYCINKGDVPLFTIRVDHLGPLDVTSKNIKCSMWKRPNRKGEQSHPFCWQKCQQTSRQNGNRKGQYGYQYGKGQYDLIAIKVTQFTPRKKRSKKKSEVRRGKSGSISSNGNESDEDEADDEQDGRV
ncbi:unnamed protein product [Ceratitis capitata]|uniref:(Mediterranean fruit fly) hypothetical protein n=1 Tax=Ceratitis capitata TaxID=7213 RepID=A0A811US30_CERCA|nr:unnamed protein product [Ceratitis capitata]